MTLYFDDLEVGQQFTSGTYTMTADAIRAFAASFDPQPFHLDVEAAQGSLFGSLVASGWHTGAVTMRLLVESIPFSGGLIGTGGTVNWPQPTHPGDSLHVVSEITELRASRSKPDRGLVTARSETRNQRGEAVQILVSTMVVPRRAGAS